MVAEMLIIVAIIAVCGVLFFTSFGKRLRLRIKGTADEVITKDSSTLEGAKAYYNVAITKKEEDYQQAYSVYTQMLGKIQTYEEQLRTFKKEKMQLGLNINACIDKGDDEGAKTCLKNQQEVADKEEIVENALKELRENSSLQKETVDSIFEGLDALKKEKEKTILTLETAQSNNSLKATPSIISNEEDKMLEKVRESVRKTKEKADGNKIAYESSATVQAQRLNKRLKDDEIDKKLQELKASRKK